MFVRCDLIRLRFDGGTFSEIIFSESTYIFPKVFILKNNLFSRNVPWWHHPIWYNCIWLVNNIVVERATNLRQQLELPFMDNLEELQAWPSFTIVAYYWTRTWKFSLKPNKPLRLQDRLTHKLGEKIATFGTLPNYNNELLHNNFLSLGLRCLVDRCTC